MAQRFDLDNLSTASEYAAAGASLIATPTGKKVRASLAADEAAARAAAEAGALADAEMAARGGLIATETSGGLWAGIKGIAGYVATPLMLLAGAFQTAKSVKKKDGHGAAQAAGGAVGSIAGMMATDTVIGMVGGPAGGILGAVVGLGIGIGTTIAGGWAGSKAADGMVGDAWHQSLNKASLQPSRLVPSGYHLQQLPAADATTDRPGSFFTQRLQQERAEKQRIIDAQVQQSGMGH